MGFVYPQYEFHPSADSAAEHPVRHPVVVIGAGPVGLATAIDFAQRGRKVVLLDDDTSVSHGSRGLCYAKRTLEIFDRLGCAAPIVDKGVTWQVGKVFHGPQQIYAFDLLPEGGHRFPAFVNLQQYWLEKFLVDRALALPNLDLRFASKVAGLDMHADHVGLGIETPAGSYRIEADWVVACDGARSPTRKMLGLDFKGRVFEDRFLIADVRMQAEFPTERWFWFDPPFHEGGSTLLHKQPDDLWRIDFQLGANADPTAEKDPARVIPRVQAMLGPDVAFELEWVSVYTFQCRRLERLRHGRVLFAGDAAHQVSPFGARGANSGVQDADNLVWKLCAVLDGHAPETLLDSYDAERGVAADENIGHSTRATDFITPKKAASRCSCSAARRPPCPICQFRLSHLLSPTIRMGLHTSVTTPPPARPICFGRTNMCAAACAHSTRQRSAPPMRVRAARRYDDGETSQRTRFCRSRCFLRQAGRGASRSR